MVMKIRRGPWSPLERGDRGDDRNGWMSKDPRGPMGSGVWKGIFKGRELFSNHTHFQVNNGKMVLFWHDVWCSNEPLSIFVSFLL